MGIISTISKQLTKSALKTVKKNVNSDCSGRIYQEVLPKAAEKLRDEK